MADKMAVYGLRHQRGRLAGEIKKLKDWNRRHEARVEELLKRIASNKSKLEVLTSQIEALGSAAEMAFAIALAPPVPRQTVPKRHLAGWGTVTRETLRHLKEANGTPLTSLQIAQGIDVSLQLNLSSDDLRHLMKTVRKTMERLINKKVMRFAEAPYPGGHSTWVLADTVE